MTIQEVADVLGPLGFIPEWRYGENHQQWVHPVTRVVLDVKNIDGRLQYRRIVPGRGVFSEWQTDDCNYGDLTQALRD